MSAETTAHNIRTAIDRLATEIANRVVKEESDRILGSNESEAKQALNMINVSTFGLVFKHARATLIDWMLGDLKETGL